MPEQAPEASRLAQQRLDDRVEAAFARGREAERINGRLLKLEDHSKSVNGQILRLANGQDGMNDQLKTVIKHLDEAALVNDTLKKAAEQSGAKALGRWQAIGIKLGVPVGAVTIVLYLIDVIRGVHG